MVAGRLRVLAVLETVGLGRCGVLTGVGKDGGGGGRRSWRR
jgi:hypothetical protein